MNQDERRQNSLETVLVSLGRLEESNAHIHETVCDLKERVGIQNGKVGKLERWQSYTQGCVMILVVMIVPIIINFVTSWIEYAFHK